MNSGVARAQQLGEGVPQAEWTWLLDRGLSPDPGALEALLAHAAGADGPLLLAGLVLDAVGRPVPWLLPRAPEDDPAAVVAAVVERTLPLRWCRLAHALVHREAVARHGAPDGVRFGPHASVEWSRRVLAVATGRFVPASVVRQPAGVPLRAAPTGPRAARGALRAVRAGAWTPAEGLRAAARDLRGGP